MRYQADSQADLRRFVQRVAARETVWLLKGPDGVAVCGSNEFVDEEEEPATVLLFFSDRAYAERVRGGHFPDCAATPIALFDFLYRWLPGMTGDGRLAGPNWTGGLVGCEVDPFDLRMKISEAMTPAQAEAHRQRYEALTGGGG